AFLDLASSRGETGSLHAGQGEREAPRGHPSHQVRTTLPSLAVVAVVAYLLARRVMCGPRPAGRVDIAVSPVRQEQAPERHRERHGKCCACQQDVRKYYDALRAIRVARWLRDETGSSDEAAALVKLQGCPLVVLKVWFAFAALSARTVGMHTGSRSAGARGRIPLLDVASQRDPAAAIRIQDDCAEQLSR
ncbi:unnamed protein product, partial [Prorocentrum cordatum]